MTDTRLQDLLGVDLPIIQAPMAGVQLSPLAVAVSNAGALGSLPCAMLSPVALRKELEALRSQSTRPYNVNFFCHAQPVADAAREQAWQAALAPYHQEFGIDPATIVTGPGRLPFSLQAAQVLEDFAPAVVSFHFGLPAVDQLARARRWGAKVLSTATTVDEARWLEAYEAQGSGDFSPLWAGQNTQGCRELPAAQLTHELAAGLR